ncbi:MAG: MltA domain-containing protein [Alphaproteobacteria bacterium]|nr:MltA domain-containing protein [Alphaproteobacteria bacterium]
MLTGVALLSAALGFLGGRHLFPREVVRIEPPAPPPPEKPAERLTLAPVSFSALPGWGEDDAGAALGAFARSCTRLDGQSPERPLAAEAPSAGTVAQWRALCAAVPAKPDKAAAQAFIERWFQPYRAANNDDPSGLFTGYYEAELKGARGRDGRFTTPLYRVPNDLVLADLGQFAAEFKGRSIAGRVEGGRLVRYADRAAIDGGLLEGKGLELLWVDDPVDAFFLHVQGSGKVLLPDGSATRVGFAGHNGHGFVPIGRMLIDSGKIPREKMSMQAVRDWLRANPDEARALMHKNPRYIFFREVAGGDGPVGAQGVALTPGRSLAVDRRYVPLGVPIWLDTTMPGSTDKKLRRLVVAQDTGGAILGPVRGDFFWGAGEKALEEAGRMRSKGGYYLLLPKAAAP